MRGVVYTAAIAIFRLHIQQCARNQRQTAKQRVTLNIFLDGATSDGSENGSSVATDSSGSGSDGGSSGGGGGGDGSAYKSSLGTRRCRTWFSPKQIDLLERAFRANAYPDARQREHIAHETDLCESKISVWLSNRRARFRKSVTSASLERWNSAIRDSNVNILDVGGVQTAPSAFRLAAASSSPSSSSPPPLISASCSSPTLAHVAIADDSHLSTPSPSSSASDGGSGGDDCDELPPQQPSAFCIQPNVAQLLTSQLLLLCSRPEYLHALQNQSFYAPR